MVKEKILYVCPFCNTEYADKNKAVACEASHKPVDQDNIEDIQVIYKSKAVLEHGEPFNIKIKFKGDFKWYSYKRC